MSGTCVHQPLLHWPWGEIVTPNSRVEYKLDQAAACGLPQHHPDESVRVVPTAERDEEDLGDGGVRVFAENTPGGLADLPVDLVVVAA